MGSLLNVVSKVNLLAGWLEEIGEGLVDLIIGSILGPILWVLCDIFFIILDLFEMVFKVFAGGGALVENAYGQDVEGDLVLYLVNSAIVQQIFFSILILSFFLLIIFTILAIVKNMYAEKQEPISKIINSSFKALLMYLLVPVATIVCLLVGQVVLTAVDGATRETSGSTSASSMLFTAAAYSANRLRDDDLEICRSQLKTYINLGLLVSLEINDEVAALGITDSASADQASRETIERVATLIDQNIGQWQWNYHIIYLYYQPIYISILTVWIGGAFLIWAIGKITWGLISRMFKMTLYFAISPAVMATFPLDNGNALNSWRKEMVKLGTMVIVTIGVMNVFYSILPIINELKLFGNNAVSNLTINNILKILMAIIGFSSAKDLISSISSWFGTGDAIKEGLDAKKQYSSAKDKLKGYANKGLGMFAGMKGGWELAGKQGGDFKDKMMASMQGLYKTSGLSKKQDEFQKTFQEGKKSGEDAYKNFKTKTFAGSKNEKGEAEWEENADKATKKKQYASITGVEGSAYDPGLDNGLDPNQLKYREYLKNVSTAGQAIYETELNDQKLKEAKNKKDKEFLDVMNTVAKAQKGRLKAEEKLKAEFDALYGAGTFESVAEDDRVDMVKAAIRGASATGKNVDMLQDLLQGFEDAKKSLKDAKDDIADRAYTDTDFGEYVGAGGAGEALYNAVMGDISSEWDRAKTALRDNVKEANDLVKKAEELEKKMAKKNEDYILGNITDPGEKAKIEAYNKAHPKS